MTKKRERASWKKKKEEKKTLKNEHTKKENRALNEKFYFSHSQCWFLLRLLIYLLFHFYFSFIPFHLLLLVYYVFIYYDPLLFGMCGNWQYSKYKKNYKIYYKKRKWSIK